MSSSGGVVAQRQFFSSNLNSDNPGEFQGSPHAVIASPPQIHGHIDLNRSQSAPADVQKAHAEAAKFLESVKHLHTGAYAWKPTTSLSLLQQPNGGSKDAVLEVVERIRDELYAKYPHLKEIDLSKGERLDG